MEGRYNGWNIRRNNSLWRRPVRKREPRPCIHLFDGFKIPRAIVQNQAPLYVQLLNIFLGRVFGKASSVKCTVRVLPQGMRVWKKSRKCDAILALADRLSADAALGLSSKYQCHGVGTHHNTAALVTSAKPDRIRAVSSPKTNRLPRLSGTGEVEIERFELDARDRG
jgi:hypothetical protein